MKIEEIAEQVAIRFTNGKGRCMKGGMCVYHNGLKGDGSNNCIVGHFLSDKHGAMNPEVLMGVERLCKTFPKDSDDSLPDFIYDHIELFDFLQLIHDNRINWEDDNLNEKSFDFIHQYFMEHYKVNFNEIRESL